MDIKVLVGCEESQTLTKAFRSLGVEAFSNDLLDCSGGHPEWHIKGDVFAAASSKEWDLALFFPPCTFLTVAGNKWMKPEFRHRFPHRAEQRRQAVEFVVNLYNLDIEHIAIENPVGVLSSEFRKPNQYVQPYYFGDPHSKKTGLWLKNLPLLTPTDMVEPEFYVYKNGKRDPVWHKETLKIKDKAERSRIRSVVFHGMATQMATQWTQFLKDAKL